MSVTRDWLSAASTPAVAAPQLRGIDHIEFWVGNARASAAFFAACYGFEIVAYAGPETGVTDRVSYVLTQGDIRFVVTAGIGPPSPSAALTAAPPPRVRAAALLPPKTPPPPRAPAARRTHPPLGPPRRSPAPRPP